MINLEVPYFQTNADRMMIQNEHECQYVQGVETIYDPSLSKYPLNTNQPRDGFSPTHQNPYASPHSTWFPLKITQESI